MQLTTIILALATAISTSAAAVSSHHRYRPREFDLTNFYFGGSPHSILQEYTFDVTDGKYSAHCQTSSSITPGLEPFGLTPCSDSCFSFSFTFVNRTHPEPGYVLTVTQEVHPGLNHTACRFYGQDKVQLVVDQFNPNGNFYDLNSPDAFNLTYSDGPCFFN